MEEVVNVKGMRRLSMVVLACFVGAPLMAAPLAFGQPNFRPLTIRNTLQVVQAFGADDEDCVFEIQRSPRPAHQFRVTKKLVCEE